MRKATLVLFTMLLGHLQAQSWEGRPTLRWGGFVDAFYAFDFNRPGGRSFRQDFFFNHNRHNEFNVNLALARIQVDHDRYRANIALQTGTYAADNYAAEPAALRNIFEANVGVALNKQGSLWLDAGIFPSHLGFESAVSLDNWTLTRSLVAENSPYYLSGAKLGYTPNERWHFKVLICNGWQRIERIPGSSLPSFGSQVSYQASRSLKLNWSTFVGTDFPDSTRRMRYFNNLYGKWKLNEKWRFLAGFDAGLQQRSRHSSQYQLWYAPVLIAQYAMSAQWQMALRAEYYDDQEGAIIAPVGQRPFQSSGASWNIDYQPHPQLACRVEARWLRNQQPYFLNDQALSRHNLHIVASLAVKFWDDGGE